eukprot:TRINITY_DN45863_c0_g1_i1.p1 TRINITY_DN45863_c0_g1~~TRINITY_DN45863_c0_g1_i1.p1  ORF type:complete len:323 (+),score=25.74 TRINITY_DN45863_c0_g1_i1:145-1113(+)
MAAMADPQQHCVVEGCHNLALPDHPMKKCGPHLTDVKGSCQRLGGCPYSSEEGRDFCKHHQCPHCPDQKPSMAADCGRHAGPPCCEPACPLSAVPELPSGLCIRHAPRGSCQHAECPFNAEPEKQFCVRHLCPVCGVEKSSTQSDCRRHFERCRTDGCERPVVAGLTGPRAGLCPNCAGPGSCGRSGGCPFDKDANGSFCTFHQCPVQGCSQQKSGSEYHCGAHPCKAAPSQCPFPGLDALEGPKKGLCAVHAGKGGCRREGCPFDPKDGSTGLCTAHLCACGEEKSVRDPVCKKCAAVESSAAAAVKDGTGTGGSFTAERS